MFALSMAPFLVALGLSLYMTGVIWCMQILEYPLFAFVGPAEFRAYHAAHNRTLFGLVILPSLLATVGALALIVWRPVAVPLWLALAVAIVDLVIILSTALWQAPLHARLDRDGYSAEVIRTLVRANWLRTLAWTLNTALLLGAVALIAARAH